MDERKWPIALIVDNLLRIGANQKVLAVACVANTRHHGRYLLTISASLLFSIQIFAQDSLSFDWSKPSFHHAVAYMYSLEREGDCGWIIDENGTLSQYVVDTIGFRLNTDSVVRVLTSIFENDESTFSEPRHFYMASPHHGIVFYDEDERVLAHLSVCFISGITSYYPQVNGIFGGYTLLESLFDKTPYPVFDRPEFYWGWSRIFNEGIDTSEAIYSTERLDVVPEFIPYSMGAYGRGGMAKMEEYIADYVFSSVSSADSADFEIEYSFVVEKTGEITFPSVSCQNCGLESKRLLIGLYLMPNWKPGLFNKGLVRSKVEARVYLKKRP